VKEADMDIKRSGSQPSSKGPAEYFTGTVRVDPLFEAADPARVVGASVTFEPGARTAWHTHPLGQTLIVTARSGRAQRWRGPIEEIRPGDVVWFAPGEKHWHGATATTAVTHSITERDVAENIHKFYETYAIPAESFAQAVAFAMSQPEDVDVNEILFRPTRQEL
jgi:quercetin dioxygenase-like cupin family protein